VGADKYQNNGVKNHGLLTVTGTLPIPNLEKKKRFRLNTVRRTRKFLKSDSWYEKAALSMAIKRQADLQT